MEETTAASAETITKSNQEEPVLAAVALGLLGLLLLLVLLLLLLYCCRQKKEVVGEGGEKVTMMEEFERREERTGGGGASGVGGGGRSGGKGVRSSVCDMVTAYSSQWEASAPAVSKDDLGERGQGVHREDHLQAGGCGKGCQREAHLGKGFHREDHLCSCRQEGHKGATQHGLREGRGDHRNTLTEIREEEINETNYSEEKTELSVFGEKVAGEKRGEADWDKTRMVKGGGSIGTNHWTTNVGWRDEMRKISRGNQQEKKGNDKRQVEIVLEGRWRNGEGGEEEAGGSGGRQLGGGGEGNGEQKGSGKREESRGREWSSRIGTFGEDRQIEGEVLRSQETNMKESHERWHLSRVGGSWGEGGGESEAGGAREGVDRRLGNNGDVGVDEGVSIGRGEKGGLGVWRGAREEGTGGASLAGGGRLGGEEVADTLLRRHRGTVRGRILI